MRNFEVHFILYANSYLKLMSSRQPQRPESHDSQAHIFS